uniref:1-phosphatidylinositol 4,5-bisphosphate phosphodiesterase gamma n=1 Tax=Tetraodon nigroviridis TaxID=99883 RepID=H3C2R3_TETNG
MAQSGQQGEMTDYKKSLIKRDLEMGAVMTVFRQKAERLTVQVIMETRQVAWTRTADKTDGVLDLFEIREIRPGRNSKDFERFRDGKDKHDENACFTIFYGSQFVLNTLSLGVDSVTEAQKWLTGLELLWKETLEAPTPVLIESWLRKQMYSVNQTKTNSITVKELKTLLPLLNYKAPGARALKDKFQEVGSKKDRLDFEQFHKLYNHIMFEQNEAQILNEFKKDSCAFILGNTDKPDASAVMLHDFQRFLVYDQKECWAADLNQVRELMTIFIDDTMSKTNDPVFTVSEFLGYLFSEENSIWDKKVSEISCMDMNNPLSHYWINSSHNTYLTGDQLRSESSTEAYVRALRLGCRCVELDCWEGPGEPIIYHGWTRTTKIKFEDVVKAINDHAFVTSEFPVILSIEEHCPIEQQRQMARIFRDVFGDKLLSEPVEQVAEQLPSPTQLKGKIILKHKKLSVEGGGTAKDLRKGQKQGDLQIWDPVDKQWNKHYCVISDDNLYYAEEEEQEEEDTQKVRAFQDLHCTEPWFHGHMKDGRQMAERLIYEYCAETGGQDGTFLVRPSDRVVLSYTLSFWRNGRVQHCRVRVGNQGGRPYYFLTANLHFPSLISLIQHYRENPLRCQDFELRLTDAVPQPSPHLNEGWFYSDLSRGQAEDYLMRIPRDGAFLIRQREGEPDSFAITFKGDGKVKHCRIQKEGTRYLLGTTTYFESLVELVSYFRNRPLYRKIKLRYPVTPELVERFSMGKECASLYSMKMYVEPNEIESALPKNAVRALYCYQATRPDELSFNKGALIYNVSKETDDWWKGDYGGKVQFFFPANHVEEVSRGGGPELTQQVMDDNPLGELCKGVVDISKCNILNLTNGKNGKPHVLTLQDLEDDSLQFDLSAETLEELFEWYQAAWDITQRKISKEYNRQHEVEVEKKEEVAMEMSDLVVYCQPRSKEKDRFDSYTYKEIRSFVENKVPGKNRTKEFLLYNRKALSRIYPKGQRVESSNYDPYPLWAVGCQMVALNFQTADKYTQLNSALFSLNGGTGYVLQPEVMRSDVFDPLQEKNRVMYMMDVRIIAARHLPKPGRSIASPFVEVELCGHTDEKFKTAVYRDNGLNPVWKAPAEPMTFTVHEHELAFLRFVVYEEDMFSDPNFLAQATFPVQGIRSGYRSVPMRNGYSERLELASLLVHIDIKTAGRMEEELYSSSSNLRKKSEVGGELFLYETQSNLQRSSLPRQQNHLLREFSTSEKQRAFCVKREYAHRTSSTRG